MTNEMSCPIWGTAVNEFKAEDYGRRRIVDSPRAGGRFVLVGSEHLVSHLDDDQKVRLTTYIVDQNRLGVDLTVIDKTTVELVKNTRSMSVLKRCDRFLMYIRRNTRKISDGVLISDPEKIGSLSLGALAWTESHDMNDLKVLSDYCIEKSLVRANPTGLVYRLTVDGYDRLDELDRGERSSTQAFVAMWFNDSMSDAYAQGIAIGVRDAGYEPLRIDEKEHARKIDDEIIAEIRRSRFVVADFTAEKDKPRGGVYFEARFAHGLNIPVIWTCREDIINDVHFDTRQFNHIVWTSAEDLRQRLKNRIEAVIGEGPLKTISPS